MSSQGSDDCNGTRYRLSTMSQGNQTLPLHGTIPCTTSRMVNSHVFSIPVPVPFISGTDTVQAIPVRNNEHYSKKSALVHTIGHLKCTCLLSRAVDVLFSVATVEREQVSCSFCNKDKACILS